MGERFQNLDKNFVCSFFNCKASFSKSWKLEAHLCKHTGLRPFACASCDKSFCTRYQLTRHHLTHSGEKPYRCSVEGCPQTFASNGNMKNHVARVHMQKENQYVCEIDGCGKEFRKRNHLKTHTCEHTNILTFECNFQGCKKKFTGIKPLQKHGKVHDGYPCAESGCSFKGNTWSEYQKHRKQQHRPVLHCDSCKKVYRETWFLEMHQHRVHLGERRVFSCTKQGCQKSYTTEFSLKSHVLSIHEGKTPFKCPHAGCSKAFAMKESLKRHGVVHDPEKKKMKKKGAPKANKAATAAVPDASKLAARLQSLKLGKAKAKPTDKAKPEAADKAKAKPTDKPNKPKPRKC